MAIQISNGSVSQQQQSPIVGIDLGTTHSLVAFVKNGVPEVLTSREGRRLVPSIVSFAGDKPVIGYGAKAAKIRDAGHTVFSVKRLLGRGIEDVRDAMGSLPYEIVAGQGGLQVKVGDRAYSAIEISAMILRELKLAAEQALGTGVSRAVITVPAYFNDSQRQATRAAGRLAGLDVLRIVNEPTAAALAYGLDKKREGLIAVYDLGGGTFDISILKLHNGIFEVLATHGNTALGGDDLDQVISGAAVEEIRAQFGVDALSNVQLRAELIENAERVKVELSTHPKASLEIDLSAVAPGKKYRREWTLSEFESGVRPILMKTAESCLSALKDAGLKASDLSDVVLVGGPTRLRVVQEVVREIFGHDPNTSVHPDEVVAAGAAIQADILAGNNKDLLLLDVVPLSLGIETYGGLMTPLITRNTRIPTVARETYTTFVENQTAVDVHVLQGEREKVEDNRSLARFKLRVQPSPAGVPRVEVSFLIDADGILQVAARDLKTGNEQSVEVRPSYGLTDEQVEQMLLSGMEHADEDVFFRRLVEARNKFEPVLRGAEKKMPDAKRLLPPDEVVKIEERVQALSGALKGKDLGKIQESGKLLDEATGKLADLLIKEAIDRVNSAG